MDLQSLKELFIEQLEDALDAEKQLVKAIPDMVDAAKTPELRSAFEEHLTQTKGQVGRLEQVFSVIGEPAKEGSCDAMEGLIKEAKSMIKADGQAAVVDAGLVAAAQKVEHYEMATYGTVRTWANGNYSGLGERGSRTPGGQRTSPLMKRPTGSSRRITILSPAQSMTVPGSPCR